MDQGGDWKGGNRSEGWREAEGGHISGRRERGVVSRRRTGRGLGEARLRWRRGRGVRSRRGKNRGRERGWSSNMLDSRGRWSAQLCGSEMRLDVVDVGVDGGVVRDGDMVRD